MHKKCDLTRPSCSWCLKRNRNCVYPDDQPVALTSQPATNSPSSEMDESSEMDDITYQENDNPAPPSVTDPYAAQYYPTEPTSHIDSPSKMKESAKLPDPIVTTCDAYDFFQLCGHMKYRGKEPLPAIADERGGGKLYIMVADNCKESYYCSYGRANELRIADIFEEKNAQFIKGLEAGKRIYMGRAKKAQDPVKEDTAAQKEGEVVQKEDEKAQKDHEMVEKKHETAQEEHEMEEKEVCRV